MSSEVEEKLREYIKEVVREVIIDEMTINISCDKQEIYDGRPYHVDLIEKLNIDLFMNEKHIDGDSL